MTVINIIFWDMIPCSLVEYYKRLNFFQTRRYHNPEDDILNERKHFRSIEIWRRKHKQEEIFRAEFWNQNLLPDSEKKQLQWLDHVVKGTDETRARRGAELEIEGRKPGRRPRMQYISKIFENIRKRGIIWQETGKRRQKIWGKFPPLILMKRKHAERTNNLRRKTK